MANRIPGQIEELRAVAEQINLHGWAEANAGNVSVNVSAEAQELFGADHNWFWSRAAQPLPPDGPRPFPKCCWFVLTVPARNTIKLQADLGMELLKLLQKHFPEIGRADKVVLHAHPNSIILLSQLNLYADESALNALLREALAELELFLPEGIAAPAAAPQARRNWRN